MNLAERIAKLENGGRAMKPRNLTRVVIIGNQEDYTLEPGRTVVYVVSETARQLTERILAGERTELVDKPGSAAVPTDGVSI
jgi:hypothetical protein